jgi:hypothetical protein
MIYFFELRALRKAQENKSHFQKDSFAAVGGVICIQCAIIIFISINIVFVLT